MMGSPADILSAFHLSPVGILAASITLAKMVDDHLPSNIKVFFDPPSKGYSAPNAKGRVKTACDYRNP